MSSRIFSSFELAGFLVDASSLTCLLSWHSRKGLFWNCTWKVLNSPYLAFNKLITGSPGLRGASYAPSLVAYCPTLTLLLSQEYCKLNVVALEKLKQKMKLKAERKCSYHSSSLFSFALGYSFVSFSWKCFQTLMIRLVRLLKTVPFYGLNYASILLVTSPHQNLHQILKFRQDLLKKEICWHLKLFEFLQFFWYLSLTDFWRDTFAISCLS